jgi:hypothetical protein
MARGRPIIGVDLIERLDGPRALRRDVRIVLATIAGGLTIAQACAALGIGRSRFHALRWRVLAGALDALRPRPRGRPRRVIAESSEVRQLRARIQELEVALRTTALRSEIALTMPHLLDRAGRKKKSADRRPSSTPRRGRVRPNGAA